MKTVFSYCLLLCLSVFSFQASAAQKKTVAKSKAAVHESWSHDDLMAYLKDHPEKMDLEAVSTIRAENTKFSEADKMLLYSKYLKGLRGGAFAHYYHFWTFFHTDVSKASQAELAAEIIKETGKNFNEHTNELAYDSCSYFLPTLIEGAKEWYSASALNQHNARIDSTRSMMLWSVVKLMERNTGWLFAHVGDFSFSKDLMAECDSFRHYSIPYLYDSNPELTAKMAKERTEHFLYSPAMNAQPLGAALNIYQLVLNYYSSDTLLRDRLILGDLMRLQFVNTCFSGPSAKTAWREAIQRLLVHNGTNSSSTLVAAQLATYLFRLSKENESPEQGSAESWYRFQAYNTAKQFSARFPDGLGAKACRMLMREISQSDFSAELDQQWYPNTPTLLKLKYKNMRKLYVYVFDLKNPNDTSSNPQPGTLISLQQFPLKDFGDYYEHRTQLALNGFPAGKYYVELSDTVITYEDAARLSAYVIVAPARVSYFTNTSGVKQAIALDINSGEVLGNKWLLVDSMKHFPYSFKKKSNTFTIGSVAEIATPTEKNISNELKHQLPKPSLSLNKAAYLPGDIVECVAKISPQEYKRFIHLGGFTPLLLNQGQAINVKDFVNVDPTIDPRQQIQQRSTAKMFWFNKDNQFVIRFHLDSILRDGDYMLQVGDASINIPVRAVYNEGSFTIKGPAKASFGERMHFTAKWNNALGTKFKPQQINVAVALLSYNDDKLTPSRYVLNQTIKVNADGSFAFDFVPSMDEKYEEQSEQSNLSRYTFTWSFLDSSAQVQTQFNRYYISNPEALLVSEIPEIVEYNNLLESLPIIKSITADGLMLENYPCTAQVVRLRNAFITPVNSTFTPDYFTMPVDSFRAKFPYFAYGGENNIQNFTTRDTVLNVQAISTDALLQTLFPKMDNGAYMFQIQSTDPHLKTKQLKSRFYFINPLDEKNECPEWLSITFHYDGPMVHCAKKGQAIQCYFFSDKGIIKHSMFKSNGKWKKLKCPNGTRYVVLETYVAGKHIVHAWAWPELAMAL